MKVQNVEKFNDLKYLDNWCVLPTPMGNFRMYDTQNENLRVICFGDIYDQGIQPIIRIHSSCLASEVFSATDCDCADQLHETMKLIATEGKGIIFHLHQEGRGQGLSLKIKAVSKMQKEQLDTFDAFEKLGLEQDIRTYENVVYLLTLIGIESVRLVSNNPRKINYLKNQGIQVIPVNTHPSIRIENADYLLTKKIKLGHHLLLENSRDESDIYFYHSDQPWGELSNFSKHSIFIMDRIWPTVEHFYQAQKFKDTIIGDEICCASTPILAKIIAQNYLEYQRPDWIDVKNTIMLLGLRAKFIQHPHLKKKLLLSNHRKLIEHTTKDSYWGDGGDGSGQNMLGKLLMQIRSDFQKELTSF